MILGNLKISPSIPGRQGDIQMEERDRIAAHSIATKLHRGNIDISTSQGSPDIPDHSRSVIIIHQQDVPFRNGFDEKIIQLDDPQFFPPEESPCNIILLHLRPGGNGDQTCKILRPRRWWTP